LDRLFLLTTFILLFDLASGLTHDLSYNLAYRKTRHKEYLEMNYHLETIYGIKYSSENPSLRFKTFQPYCNHSLCGDQPFSMNLASKFYVGKICQEQNLTSYAPDSFMLDNNEEIDQFEASFPCDGVNTKFIFKSGTVNEEYGEGLRIPPNYTYIRHKYLVPYEDWCDPLYKNYSYEAVGTEVEDRIWANRDKVVAQELIVPYTYLNMSHSNLRFYIISFYPKRKHFMYRRPHWTFNPILFNPLDIRSIIYTKYQSFQYIDHDDLDESIRSLANFSEILGIASKIFSKQKIIKKKHPWWKKTPTFELTSIDFLLDKEGKLRFLFDVTQVPIILGKSLPNFWPDFFELLFDLKHLPTRNDHCSSIWFRLETGWRKKRNDSFIENRMHVNGTNITIYAKQVETKQAKNLDSKHVFTRNDTVSMNNTINDISKNKQLEKENDVETKQPKNLDSKHVFTRNDTVSTNNAVTDISNNVTEAPIRAYKKKREKKIRKKNRMKT